MRRLIGFVLRLIDFGHGQRYHPIRAFITESDKMGREYKHVKNLYCRCIGCQNFERCHGLCKKHRNEKRSYGYAC